MKKIYLKKLFVLAVILLGIVKSSAQICNSSGNLIIYSNYDGGVININVNANIPNLKIGICSYESASVNISGPFASNVTQVVYAGSGDINDPCGLNVTTPIISGVSASITTILINPSIGAYNPVHGNGSNIISCATDCDTIFNAGGCNTPDELVYYFSQVTGGVLRYHETGYNCWNNATYSVTSGGNCCINVAASPTCSVPPPPVNVTTSQNSNICASQTTTLAVTSTATVNWYASASSTAIIATGSNYIITPTITSGVINLYAGATNTCSGSIKTLVTVTVSPTPKLQVHVPTKNICSSQSTTLFATSSINTFSWSTGATSSSIVVTPTVNTNYNVVSTSTNNCSASQNVQINVFSSPNSPSVSVSSTSLCQPGGTVNLSGISSMSNTISWYTSSLSASPFTTTPSGSSFPLSVNTTTTIFAATTTTFVKDLNYNFTNGATQFISPASNSTFTFEVWGAQGGGSSISGNSFSGPGGKGGYAAGILTVAPNSTLNIYVGGHGLSTITGSAAGGFNGGGQGHASSNSEPGNGGGGATDIRVNGNSLADRVIIAGGGGGGGEDAGDPNGHGGGLTGVGYTAYDATQTAPGAGGGLGFGGGTGNGDGGGGGGGLYGGGTFSSTTGQDTQGGGGGSGYIGGVTSGTLIAGNLGMPNPVGSGTVLGQSLNGYAKLYYVSSCPSVFSSVNVTVFPSPTASIASSQSTICAGQSATLSNSGSASSYSWSNNSSNSIIVVSPTINTVYSLTVTSAAGCKASNVFTLSVKNCTNLLETKNSLHVKVYPNPAQNEVKVDVEEESIIRIIDVMGRVIIDKKIKQGINVINIEALNNGIYWLEVETLNSKGTSKIIKS